MTIETNNLVSQLIAEFVEIVDACKSHNRSQTDLVATMLMTCRAWKYADAGDDEIQRIDAILEKTLVQVAIYSAKDMTARPQIENAVVAFDSHCELLDAVKRYFAK